MRSYFIFLFSLVVFPSAIYGQEGMERLPLLEKQIAEKELEIDEIRSDIEDIKLQDWAEKLEASGLPTSDYVIHRMMAISFDPEHQQAEWVAHIISPDIAQGSVGRTNDFRDDPLIDGEAVEQDYFLKELQADSSYAYDGFGYDRGHLAPSADFAWSRKALSESYFYSNMSPQLPDFNREDWAELEAVLRGYVLREEVGLYIYTLPIIDEGYRFISRGVNQLPIPQRFLKVALDPVNERGVAFLMDNEATDADLADFAISVDRAEELTNLDFFSKIGTEKAEASFELDYWFPASARDGVQPIYAPSLPEGHINTTQAKRWMGSTKKVHVCGTVVSTRFSGSGNYWMNVDKKFPNTVFNVYIRKEDFSNFDSIHKEYLLNEKVCYYGKVATMYGQPNMNVVRQEQIVLMD